MSPASAVGCGALSPAASRSGKKHHLVARIASFVLLLLLPMVSSALEAAKIRIVVDTPAGLQQKIYLTRPAGLTSDRPIIFVMHDRQRKASSTRDQWHELAKEHNFLLVVPEFNDRFFPGAEGYELGNVFDAAGKARPRTAWSFSAIEPVFDEVRRRYGMTTPGYAIFGQSAGAQFVHRFLFHVPDARVTQAVAANADAYTMPVFNQPYPSGLRSSVVSSGNLAAALQRPLLVLLGAADGDPDETGQVVPAGAMAQGPCCFTRGQAFFDAGADAATRLGVPFGWQLVTVPGAEHDSTLLAPAAIPWLLQGTGPAVPASAPVPEDEALPATLPTTGP
jgi:poly(3-hydroxybutyrate) depolymerase